MSGALRVGKDVHPVILAGGGGTRLWPLSGEHKPKQFLSLVGEDTLFEATLRRLQGFCSLEALKIVCGSQHRSQLLAELAGFTSGGADHLVVEPCARNTGPAVLLAIKTILQQSEDPILMVMPVDHMIADVNSFHRCLQLAVTAARTGAVATLGVTPHQPETGYGYIETRKTGEDQLILPVTRFVEKPDRETAEHYLASGRFFWNAGIFVFRASAMLVEFQRFQPAMCEKVDAVLAGNPEAYEAAPKLSVDYAVMEHTRKAVAVPAQMGWSDLGGWNAVYEQSAKDVVGNAVRGNVHLQDCRNVYFHSFRKPVVGLGVENLIVVDAPDALLVAHPDKSQEVGTLSRQIRQDAEEKPVSDLGDGCGATRREIPVGEVVTVQPSCFLSWTVACGKAGVENETYDRGACFSASPGVCLEIQNTGSQVLVLIEVAVGAPNEGSVNDAPLAMDAS